MNIINRDGHNFACPGASGYCDETTEVRRYGARVRQLLTEAGNTIVDVTPGNIADEDEDLYYGINIAKQYPGADLFVSFHMNAVVNRDSHGAEVCVMEDVDLVHNIGTIMLRNLEKIGLTNRGIKVNAELAELNSTPQPAIIVEPIFCSNENDTRIYQQNFEAFCRAIANAIDGRVALQEPVKEEPIMVTLFNPTYYAKMNPDVVAAGVDLQTHYSTCGHKEGRLPVPTLPDNWNDGWYLMNHPDVNAAVSQGFCPNGRTHWQMSGWQEKRYTGKPDFLKLNQAEVTSVVNAEVNKKVLEIKSKMEAILK